MIDSPLCAFCQTEVESLEHIFFHCNVTKTFWNLLSSWLIKQKMITTSLTLENVLFRVLNAIEDFLILNHLLLLAKFYIYRCKLDIIHPSLNAFVAKIRANFQIEQNIASKNDKLDKHYKKWNKVLPCFTKLVAFFCVIENVDIYSTCLLPACLSVIFFMYVFM